jgi:hypothetical protein
MAERDSTLLKPTRASLLKQMPGEPSSRVAGLHVSRTLQSSRVELCWVGVWYRCMGPGQLHTASPRVRTQGVALSVSVRVTHPRRVGGCNLDVSTSSGYWNVTPTPPRDRVVP